MNKIYILYAWRMCEMVNCSPYCTDVHRCICIANKLHICRKIYGMCCGDAGIRGKWEIQREYKEFA